VVLISPSKSFQRSIEALTVEDKLVQASVIRAVF